MRIKSEGKWLGRTKACSSSRTSSATVAEAVAHVDKVIVWQCHPATEQKLHVSQKITVFVLFFSLSILRWAPSYLSDQPPAAMKLLFFFVLPILPVVANKAAYACRCLYGQPCWPDAIRFAVLTNQISQPLLHPIPPASACYPPSAPSGDCSVVIANYMNGDWRSDQPGAMQLTNYEVFIFPNKTISACYFNTTSKIFRVDREVYHPLVSMLDLRMIFRQHNLKLVVKGTGHDLLGRSAARNSFLIWTHNMKQAVYNPTFLPEGALVTAGNTFDGDFALHFKCDM
jgi:hypothetical protein